MEQIINEPTRITENSQALIDLFFTNRPRNMIKSGVDHIGIMVIVSSISTGR